MAKPKIDVIVNVMGPELIVVFCADRPATLRDIESVEGVAWADNLVSRIYVHTDPRYDINELRDEIYQLLTASVPDIFKED